MMQSYVSVLPYTVIVHEVPLSDWDALPYPVDGENRKVVAGDPQVAFYLAHEDRPPRGG